MNMEYKSLCDIVGNCIGSLYSCGEGIKEEDYTDITKKLFFRRELLCFDFILTHFLKKKITSYPLRIEILESLESLSAKLYNHRYSYYYKNCRKSTEGIKKEKENLHARYWSTAIGVIGEDKFKDELKSLIESLYRSYYSNYSFDLSWSLRGLTELLHICKTSYLKKTLETLAKIWDKELESKQKYNNIDLTSFKETKFLENIRKEQFFKEIDFPFYYFIYESGSKTIPLNTLNLLEHLVKHGIVIFKEETCDFFVRDRDFGRAHPEGFKKTAVSTFNIYIFPPSNIISEIIAT